MQSPLTAAAFNLTSLFYPTGNTPAVCLTQDLPPKEKADVLLLGCGDARSILFTSWADDGQGKPSTLDPRPLDITCCDSEKAIIARNVLLMTCLLDDEAGSGSATIWNIYYHCFVDKQSLNFLDTQAKKLCAMSTSMHEWHMSEYGSILRFCDSNTLAKVRDVWSSYCTPSTDPDERKRYDERLNTAVQTALQIKKERMGKNITLLTGVRSAAPGGVHCLQDLSNLYNDYWAHGITDRDPKARAEAKYPNPMFFAQDTHTLTLHYGADPLLGFHLASAHAPLTQTTSCRSVLPHSSLHEFVDTARSQFSAWMKAFKKRAKRGITLRFIASDALAFCHTLRHRRATGAETSAHLYREQHHFEPLVLDGEDYAIEGAAPLSFNVIDTSNLIDHIGGINLLTATSPLLQDTVTAVLYTESLVKHGQPHKKWIGKLLCGHFPTMSTLFGLFPVEYWTNATTVSNADEIALNSISQSEGADESQDLSRLTWRRPIATYQGNLVTTAIGPLRFEEDDLAVILYRTYLEAFDGENLGTLLCGLNMANLNLRSLPWAHRGSFAAFLGVLKSRIALDWNKMIHALLDLIQRDTNLMIGMNYHQELVAQLHLLGLYAEPIHIEPICNTFDPWTSNGPDLRSWHNIPELVCLTLRIPKFKLELFKTMPRGKAPTPPVQCGIECVQQGWTNFFAVVQMGFGKISTSGTQNSDNFQISIDEDKDGWNGKSPLLVSFYVPSTVLKQQPQSASVFFGLQSTPHNTVTFSQTLPGLKIHETKQGNGKDVFITKHLPNQTAFPVISSSENEPEADENADFTVNLQAEVSKSMDPPQITSFIGRISIMSETVKLLLKEGAQVESTPLSPGMIKVTIGKSRFHATLCFPNPVDAAKLRTRIARKSSYIEVIAAPANHAHGKTLSTFMYPTHLAGQKPVLWNMPRVNLDMLPVLDITRKKEIDWLESHIRITFSLRERQIREKAIDSPLSSDVRVDFKDSVLTLFMFASGLQTEPQRIFALFHPEAGGVHVLIFVSCIRLDAANRTVILDAAFLPLTKKLVTELDPLLQKYKLGNKLAITIVDDAELALWKQVMPVYVERCRNWDHSASCEYAARKQIPLTLEREQTPLCSCGNGKLPANFVSVPDWNRVAKHAVRAAISPSYAVPYVEPIFDADAIRDRTMAAARAGGDVGGGKCASCGETKSKTGRNLLRCSRCHTVQYCSQKCQRTHWKQAHKNMCKK
ncbi:hypothetical protein BDY21DRAFT_407720 [Lineolata rhizophorae]|uniref:MYND-type domain-containing protein n=1 Tax=Lineolata rhizophorae TaxID=578093 RepID=A0A6A6P7W4_9PEZI|nr:hypothetical protein BDY21DRAFT_407720 [Lineolata rhizophorae]